MRGEREEMWASLSGGRGERCRSERRGGGRKELAGGGGRLDAGWGHCGLLWHTVPAGVASRAAGLAGAHAASLELQQQPASGPPAQHVVAEQLHRKPVQPTGQHKWEPRSACIAGCMHLMHVTHALMRLLTHRSNAGCSRSFTVSSCGRLAAHAHS